jgi:hypothetical protein
MNISHLTRNGLRASALGIVLTGLVLGAPAMALASPNNSVNAPTPGNARDVTRVQDTASAPTPPPGSSLYPKACLSCNYQQPSQPAHSGPPELGGSNSNGAAGTPLTIDGDGFSKGGRVHLEVHWAGAGPIACVIDTQADSAGSLHGVTACKVSPVPADDGDAYAVATDLRTDLRSNNLWVSIAR